MKARCPHSTKHTRFIATAHIAEEWVVDENGEFIEKSKYPGEVTHKPCLGDDVWSCENCGAEVIFVEGD